SIDQVNILGSAGLIGSTTNGSSGATITDNGGATTGSSHSGAGRGSGDNHEQGGSIFEVQEIGKNLAIMAIIIAVVVGGTALFRWILPETRGKGAKASGTQNL
ncbi:MAG: hypothetical protein HGA19_24775, partial [Oscillochloris sp.]|nr:hypothetical protein [Oscillochloris sp.]